MTKKYLPVLMAPVLALALAFPVTVAAEENRGVPVHERSRPDYDPLGVRAGAFLVKPEIAVALTHNDNIYARPNNTTSDWITTVAPRIKADSEWSRHWLGIDAGAKAGFYGSESDENYVDAHLRLNGRLDVQRDSYLQGRASIQRLHEERGEPDVSTTNDEPVTYTRTEAHAFYHYGVGKIALRGGGGYTGLDYSSVDQIGGGSLSQGDRDRDVYNINTRVSYELLPNVAPFVTARYEWRRYDQTGSTRDSDGYRIGLGTAFDLGGVTTGEVFGGYMKQDYDSNTREDISGAWYGLSLLSNITQMTSLQAQVQRTVKETTRTNSSGIEGTDLRLRADHELLRNLLIGAYFNYTHDKYEGTGLQPTDKTYTTGPRVTYFWNRNLSAGLEYAYRDKSSSSGFASREYTENRFMFTLTGRM